MEIFVFKLVNKLRKTIDIALILTAWQGSCLENELISKSNQSFLILPRLLQISAEIYF